MSLDFIQKYGNREEISNMLLDYIHRLYSDISYFLGHGFGKIEKVLLESGLLNLAERIIFSPPSLEVINLLHYEIPIDKKDYIRKIFSNWREKQKIYYWDIAENVF